MNEKERLIEAIKKDDNLVRYRFLEIHFNQDHKLKSDIYQLKNLQKQMINAQHIDKKKLHESLKMQYEMLLERLYDIPLLQEYLELQQYFNELLHMVSETIENELNNDFIVKNAD